jgi:hypothetical protein
MMLIKKQDIYEIFHPQLKIFYRREDQQASKPDSTISRRGHQMTKLLSQVIAFLAIAAIALDSRNASFLTLSRN